jgi:hypothetical protein
MTGTAQTLRAGKQCGRGDMSNTRSLLTSAVIATAILVTFGTLCPFAQQEVLVSANVAEVGNGYRTSELRGKSVWNDRNQEYLRNCADRRRSPFSMARMARRLLL